LINHNEKPIKKERFWEKPLGGEMNLFNFIKYKTFFNIILNHFTNIFEFSLFFVIG